jgi:hypothetical protein
MCTNIGCSKYLTSTSLEKQNRTKRFLTATWLLLFLVVFTSTDFSNVNSRIISAHQDEMLLKLRPALSAESLRNEIKELNLVCPDEAYAQMILESGNLSSFLTMRANNMLGMRFPFRRNTTASGLYLPEKDTVIYGTAASLKKYAKQNNYAVYLSWQDAVKDYKLWQDEYFRLGDRYLQFLGHVYAEDSSYESKIRTMMGKGK